MQIAVFKLNNNVLYGIDIKNVIAFIIKNEIVINDTPSQYPELEGIGTIRGEPITLFNLDLWFDKDAKKNKLDYNLIVYSKFYNKKVGFLINNMVGIYDVLEKDLRNIQNKKVEYACYININNKDDLCLVLNYEEFFKNINIDITKKEF